MSRESEKRWHPFRKANNQFIFPQSGFQLCSSKSNPSQFSPVTIDADDLINFFDFKADMSGQFGAKRGELSLDVFF